MKGNIYGKKNFQWAASDEDKRRFICSRNSSAWWLTWLTFTRLMGRARTRLISKEAKRRIVMLRSIGYIPFGVQVQLHGRISLHYASSVRWQQFTWIAFKSRLSDHLPNSVWYVSHCNRWTYVLWSGHLLDYNNTCSCYFLWFCHFARINQFMFCSTFNCMKQWNL